MPAQQVDEVTSEPEDTETVRLVQVRLPLNSAEALIDVLDEFLATRRG